MTTKLPRSIFYTASSLSVTALVTLQPPKKAEKKKNNTPNAATTNNMLLETLAVISDSFDAPIDDIAAVHDANPRTQEWMRELAYLVNDIKATND